MPPGSVSEPSRTTLHSALELQVARIGSSVGRARLTDDLVQDHGFGRLSSDPRIGVTMYELPPVVLMAIDTCHP
jgi:hypothetical protein